MLEFSIIMMESDRRAKLWMAQKPTTMVVTILAFGLRKFRAELRQRIDAWKIIAALGYPSAIVSDPSTYDEAILSQEEPIRLRVVFQFLFPQWSNVIGT